MPLSVACAFCGIKLSVPDSLVDRTVGCPKCGNMTVATSGRERLAARRTMDIQITESASTADEPAQRAPEAGAELVVFRTRSATAGLCEVRVRLDGRLVGRLNEDEELTLRINPGRHTLEVRGGSLRRSQVLTIEPGEVLEFETRFSNWGILGGGLLLDRVTQQQKQRAKVSSRQITGYDTSGVVLQLLLFAVVILVWVAGGLAAWLELGVEAEIVWNGIWLAGLCVFHYFRHLTMCPNCHRTWARLHVERRLVDRRGGYETVTRYDTHKNARGEVIGTTERREQIHVLSEVYLDFYQCKYCQHTWTGGSISQYEG